MKLLKWTAVAASVFAVAACEHGPTSTDSLQAEFDAVDPVVMTFAATQGLPGGPFGAHDGAPFMAGMPFAGGPSRAMHGRGPGAPLPDSLKLTTEQKAAILALVTAFHAANADDIAAMRAAHQAARDAHRAGQTREEVRAILEAARPAAERVRAAAAALHTAIQAILTAEQRAWLEAHRPDRPPRTP